MVEVGTVSFYVWVGLVALLVLGLIAWTCLSGRRWPCVHERRPTANFTHTYTTSVLETPPRYRNSDRDVYPRAYAYGPPDNQKDPPRPSTLSRASGTGSRRPSRRESQSSQRSQHPGPGPASRIEEQGQTPPVRPRSEAHSSHTSGGSVRGQSSAAAHSAGDHEPDPGSGVSASARRNSSSRNEAPIGVGTSFCA